MTTYGPFNRVVDSGGVYKNSTWYRQKPLNRSKPLPYSLEVQARLPKDTVNAYKSWGYYPLDDAYVNLALVKARERFNSAIGSNSSLGVTFAEWKQSLDMITRRGMQLYQFTRALRKGRFGDAADALRDSGHKFQPPPKGLRRGKSLANNFLEWHFGWSPLVKDIGDSIDVLQGPIPLGRYRARATMRRGEYSQGRWDSTVHWDTRRAFTFRAELGAEISVSNPNLYLANKLGFVNPAVIAWELVPFSFVIDWFVPVGNFLSQWTDFVGLSLQNGYTTKTAYVEDRDEYLLLIPPGVRDDRNFKLRYTEQRATGISSYKLRPGRVSGLSPVRGITAMSLILQKLR